ncbi:unnamed protein product [Blumeria hordei]|uniref:Uncharacterized protein n=2 Tax=Blumeria hordei TaxID=2867405 RepID=A0A383UVF4_BLUHO|nr:putative effector protein [Blumeria hordei DH14]SZF03716.1 unnamed protein product [Blumeria hordei]
MHCIFAVLLATEKASSVQDRMIIMSDYPYPFYGVYQPPFETRFHQPPINYDITLSKTHIEGPGTYNALYCSPTLSSENIVKLVTRGLFYLPSKDLIHQGYESHELGTCQSSIQTISQNYRQSQLPSLDDLIEKKHCTIPQIILLATEGMITVRQNVATTVAKDRYAPLELRLNRPLKMKDILTSGHVFQITNAQGRQILSWSQGQLHTFRKDRKSSKWKLLTTYGADATNVPKICAFLRQFHIDHHVGTKDSSQKNKLYSYLYNAENSIDADKFSLMAQSLDLAHKLPSIASITNDQVLIEFPDLESRSSFFNGD